MIFVEAGIFLKKLFRALCLGLLLPAVMHAQTNWNIAGTGDWLTPANWSTGGPLATTTASISNGGTATLTGVGVAYELKVGSTAGKTGTLLISGTASLSDTIGRIAPNGNATGSVTITGGTWTNSQYLHVGGIGNGTLTISGTGTVYDGNGIIGNQSNSTGL